jgi:hypothetical protein
VADEAVFDGDGEEEEDSGIIVSISFFHLNQKAILILSWESKKRLTIQQSQRQSKPSLIDTPDANSASE